MELFKKKTHRRDGSVLLRVGKFLVASTLNSIVL